MLVPLVSLVLLARELLARVLGRLGWPGCLAGLGSLGRGLGAWGSPRFGGRVADGREQVGDVPGGLPGREIGRCLGGCRSRLGRCRSHRRCRGR